MMEGVGSERSTHRVLPVETHGHSSASSFADSSLERQAHDLFERIRPSIPEERAELAMGGIIALLRTNTPAPQIELLVRGIASASAALDGNEKPLERAAEAGAHQALTPPLEPGLGSHLQLLLLANWHDRSSDPWALFRDDDEGVAHLLGEERFAKFDEFFHELERRLYVLENRDPRRVETLMYGPLANQLAQAVCAVAEVIQRAKSGQRDKNAIEQAGSDLRSITAELLQASASTKLRGAHS